MVTAQNKNWQEFNRLKTTRQQLAKSIINNWGEYHDYARQAGLSKEQVKRIAAPIGLDIGAASPAEIAIAVFAQIIEALRKRELAKPEQARIL